MRSKFFGDGRAFLVMAPDDDGKGGGGGGDDAAKKLADLQSKLDAQIKEFEALKAKHAEPNPDDKDDLAKKAQAEREKKEKDAAHTKGIETAVAFAHASKDWLKNNASLLPKSIEGIFTQAEKETYDSAIDKANAIKVGVVTEFFSQQSNLDLLTATQKNQVADFLKLTNTGKQQQAATVYDNVFEPAFEMLKRVKRAEERSKGHNTPSDAEAAYRDKLMKSSKKHYLGEKENA